VVDSETDTIIETSTLATEIDRVSSSVSWTLGSTLEHLTLTGSSGTSGYGNAAANTIVGNQESNFLRGLGGNDTMDGGAGNDWLYGDDHADTYLFGRGSGQDVVVDSDFDVGPIDVVLLGAGVARTDVVFRRDFMSLEVVIAGSADKLVVQDWYFGMVNHIEQFRFADGTVITNGQIEGLLSTMAVFGATTTSNDPQVERSIQPWRHQGYATMLP
jgi:Ca2+-binding RTX toxin-like protein